MGHIDSLKKARAAQQYHNIKSWSTADVAGHRAAVAPLRTGTAPSDVGWQSDMGHSGIHRSNRRTQLWALATAALLFGAAGIAVAVPLDERRSSGLRRPFPQPLGTAPAAFAGPSRRLLQQAPPNPYQPADAPSPALQPAGPWEVAPPATYNLGWTNESAIVPGQPFQTSGALYRPLQLGANHPLAVLVHGYHWMCEDPNVGCPQFMDQSPSCVPVPSYRGYDYLGQQLASQGVVTVSIDMNSIDCYPNYDNTVGSVLDQPWARGRLILNTLGLVQNWNTYDSAPPSLNLPTGGLVGHLDMQQVAFMGHSRGGEGVRAAYTLLSNGTLPWAYTLPNVTVRGIIELAPTDGQANTLINATGIDWSVIIPMCDGDVSDLEGIYPYDRAIQAAAPNDTSAKAVLTVWGADHNKANTVWATDPDDTFGCAGAFDTTLTGTQERNIVTEAVATFMNATLAGGNQHLFNPAFPLPSALSNLTHVDRSYSIGPSALTTQHHSGDVVAVGNVTSQVGLLQQLSGAIECPHRNVTATRLQWTNAAPDNGATLYLSPIRAAQDISAMATIDFRATRFGSPDANANPPDNTDFGVHLLAANGTLSRRIALSSWANLGGPVGQKTGVAADADDFHIMLQSVRIPLTEFSDIDLHSVAALQVAFDDTPTGDIGLAEITTSTRCA